jgi:diguanylate cyclase (GGDEF)-like protein
VQKVAELKIEEMPITTSIGVAGIEQNNFSSATQLFEAADAALYLAKQRGRNRVVVSEAASPQTEVTEEKFA